jgi:hypothetical protein
VKTLFWSHHATLTSHGTSASRASNFVREHLLDHGLPTLVDDVGLVANELAGLWISQHDQAAFNVSLRGGGGEVLLLLQDGAFRVLERLGGRHAPNGFDLRLTEELSEGWGIDLAGAGGGVVWASFAADSYRKHRVVEPPVHGARLTLDQTPS